MTSPASAPPPVEVLDLRQISAAALRPLLEEEVRAWSKRLCWDFRVPAEMVLGHVEGQLLPGSVALREGRVQGYCFFILEGTKGVIGDLFVAGETQGPAPAIREAKARLLLHSIAALRRSPGLQRIEAQFLLHAAGAVAQPLHAAGFRHHPRLFMELPLYRQAQGQGPLSTGGEVPAEVEVRRWTEQDLEPAAVVINAAYQRHIDAEINDQFRSVAGSLRLLHNLVCLPGCGVFDAAASFVALQRSTRAMLGFILCSQVKEEVGHVSQVCVLPEQRGRHLGAALVGLAAAELRRRRFRSLTLTVTQANHGAVQLYRRLGPSTQRTFDAFVWEAQ